MNYELAKQLKDAGFPQNHNQEGDFYHGGKFKMHFTQGLPDGYHTTDVYDMTRIPTLSELIEACGEKGMLFKSLIRSAEDSWIATPSIVFTYTDINPFIGIGETPEEAVAKLWLELNEK